jgi:hypothetical protein
VTKRKAEALICRAIADHLGDVAIDVLLDDADGYPDKDRALLDTAYEAIVRELRNRAHRLDY